MNRSLYRIVWFILTIFTLSGCKSCKEECDDPTNPECPNYVEPIDPCASTQPVNANFTISQYVGPGNNDLYIETQYHVRVNSLIKLSALEENASYKWIIGMDTINTREYAFQFSTDFYDQIIPLKLIVYKQPDTNCWPDDNGRDTLIRNVHVQPSCTASVLGKFYGSWEDTPQDSFLISFRLTDWDQWPGEDCNALIGRGLNGDFNDSCQVHTGGSADNFLRLMGGYCAYQTLGDPYGRFYFYPEENRIYADYYFSIEVDGQPVQQFKKFNGRKIY